MQFEVKNALTDLDQKTPSFFLQEIFHHGSVKVRNDAVEALASLDAKQKTVRVLREIIKIV